MLTGILYTFSGSCLSHPQFLLLTTTSRPLFLLITIEALAPLPSLGMWLVI